MKKSALKIIVSALLAPVVMLVILFITGLLEIIFRGEMIAWIPEIFICICVIPALLILEHKMKLGEVTLACNAAYFISAVVSGFLLIYPLVEWYVTDFYEILNPWDNDGWFTGLQWLFYLFAVYAQAALHLIIRIIIAISRRIRAERKIADKEKYGDEE